MNYDTTDVKYTPYNNLIANVLTFSLEPWLR